MSAPIKVTDLVQKSLDQLELANNTIGEEASRFERKAHIYQGLANAQGAKTANIIAYLNSDHRTWDPTDHAVVRVMLGLPPLHSEGGTDTDQPQEEPNLPGPHTAVDRRDDGHVTPVQDPSDEGEFARVPEGFTEEASIA